MDNNLPPRTHNLPPDPLLEEATERVASANRWLTERPDWRTWDKEMADKANFFISQITATWKALDDRRKDENRAWLAKQDTIYKDPLTLLTLASAKLAPLKQAWLRRDEDQKLAAKRKAEAEAEEKRKAAEESARAAVAAYQKPGADPLQAELQAERAREEAAAATAAAEEMPDKARISGSYSPRAAGLRTVWHAKVNSYPKAMKAYKAHPTVVAALRNALDTVAKSEATRLKDPAQAPDGVTFWSERV